MKICEDENTIALALNLVFLQSLQSFDHGYYLLIKSIQELRSKKDGLVTVGIGGPSGSGKTRYMFCFTEFSSREVFLWLNI